MNPEDFWKMVSQFRKPQLSDWEKFVHSWTFDHPEIAKECWEELRQSSPSDITPPEIVERFAQIAVKKYEVWREASENL